jgi:hypothetical protein
VLLIALAVLIALIVAFVVGHQRRRRAWWTKTGGLVRDARALIDLGAAGPASIEPAQQVAHWSTLEQRTGALVSGLDAVAPDAPNDQAKASIAGVSAAAGAYLQSVHTARQLRIGPPAPTPEQLGYADAESSQRLAGLRDAVAPLEQQVQAEVPPTA